MPALAEVPVRLAGEFRLFEIEMAAELAGLRGIFYRTFSGGQRPRTATLEARVGIGVREGVDSMEVTENTIRIMTMIRGPYFASDS